MQTVLFHFFSLQLSARLLIYRLFALRKQNSKLYKYSNLLWRFADKNDFKRIHKTSALKGVKFEYARQLAGQYLHTLQDFYSHSNWVELENENRKFYALTNPANSIPSQYVAKQNEETCISCPMAIEQNDNCDNNLIIQKITSGYYGGQDISKPANVSKCGHGGILDRSRNYGTRGGINKEAATRKWSPHYK